MSEPEIKTILCAVDFSEHSATVADYANLLAKNMHARVVALYVAPALSQYVGFNVPPDSIENFVGEIASGAKKTMKAFLEERLPGIDVKGEVTTGDPSEEILRVAEYEHADIIIMATHGRTGIDRFLFGSVAEKVVKSAPVPVLTVRRNDEEDDKEGEA